jgi:quinol monooxygenase YgiN
MAERVIHTALLEVRAEAAEAFRLRLLRHAAASRSEPGCLRFDAYADTEAPCRFWLHEVYADRAAFEAHRASQHFRAFRADVDGWVTDRTWWFWRPLEG